MCRLLLAALVVAIKTFDEVYFLNTFMAKVGGIPVAAINAAELKLLQLLDFRVRMSYNELVAFVEKVWCLLQQVNANAESQSFQVICLWRRDWLCHKICIIQEMK